MSSEPPVSSAPKESATFAFRFWFLHDRMNSGVTNGMLADRSVTAFAPRSWTARRTWYTSCGFTYGRAEVNGNRARPSARPLPGVTPAMITENAPPQLVQVYRNDRHVNPLQHAQQAGPEGLQHAGPSHPALWEDAHQLAALRGLAGGFLHRWNRLPGGIDRSVPLGNGRTRTKPRSSRWPIFALPCIRVASYSFPDVQRQPRGLSAAVVNAESVRVLSPAWAWPGCADTGRRRPRSS